MNVFLCGKGKGAEAVFRHLVQSGTGVCVWSYPDQGLLNLAAEYGITRRTGSVNDLDAWPFKPAMIVSIGYLDILSPEVLAQADGINCHYALLPLHAGRSAVPWAIFEGDTVTGVTWHWMTETPDAGNVILQAAMPIDDDDTQASLFRRLHDLAASTFPAALRLAWGGWEGWEQPPVQWRNCHRAGPPLSGVIGEGWEDAAVERFIRAMIYPPLAPATFRGQPVRSMSEYRAILGKDVEANA